uniref:Ig-like domain-containing protein n=1 Tax=Catagonus wagneri TaxID=51154 RepID=A0A8C3WRF9_9CETA
MRPPLLLLPLLWAALTQTPDIRVQGVLESGRPGTVTCAMPGACEWGTPPTFSWMGVALHSLGPGPPSSSVLTFTLGPGDHGTDLTCRVTFPGAGAGVSFQTTIRLNVSYGPQNACLGALEVTPGLLSAGRPGSRSRVVLGAAGGIGVTVLLALCLCVTFFLVRIYRRKSAKASNPDNEDPALSPVSMVSDVGNSPSGVSTGRPYSRVPRPRAIRLPPPAVPLLSP